MVTSLVCSNYHLCGKLEGLHSFTSNPHLHSAGGQGGEGGDSSGENSQSHRVFYWKGKEALGSIMLPFQDSSFTSKIMFSLPNNC